LIFKRGKEGLIKEQTTLSARTGGKIKKRKERVVAVDKRVCTRSESR